MKRIVLVRHAKAVPYGYEDDFSRDLTDRGRTDAHKVSLLLNSRQVIPDLIISSPANRALQTAAIFAGNLAFPIDEIQKEPGLYMEFTTGDFLDFLQSADESLSTLFVFGHNPGISYFVSRLTDNFHGDMPTCSTVGIDFPVKSWKEIEARSGKLAFQLVPKMI
jgi:phosphohistidine phosphatase